MARSYPHECPCGKCTVFFYGDELDGDTGQLRPPDMLLNKLDALPVSDLQQGITMRVAVSKNPTVKCIVCGCIVEGPVPELLDPDHGDGPIF